MKQLHNSAKQVALNKIHSQTLIIQQYNIHVPQIKLQSESELL